MALAKDAETGGKRPEDVAGGERDAENDSKSDGTSDGRRKPRRGGRKSWLLRLLSLYPPYIGAGIRVRPSRDLLTYEVRMKLRRWNRNYVGTHFGGSLYSMCDPFYMLILLAALGPGYVVWDKEAKIRFRRPGRGTVRATFHVPAERVAEIRAAADRDGKVEPCFTAQVLDEAGEVVAELEKLIYVRRKDRPAQPAG